ncbi:cytochrome P450 [Sphingomonas profundi]|uniref:cytochrome P450 n=1 Tax=Alterirhizorhabdus profundi TaxID=2681549 RepID=UPI0012E8E244|nr:cytochrome P450 [Sphingomonas profundi]
MTARCPFASPQDIDFMDPAVQENWYDAYAVLHRDAPVYYMPEIGMYVVTRYDDLDAILHDPELYLNDYSDGSKHPLIANPEAQALYEAEGWPRIMPLSCNVPEHKAFRRMVDPFLTASAVKKREPLIRAVANRLIDAWIGDGEVEFIRDFCEPLPMAIIAEALGFPAVDLPRLKRWSAAWVKPFARGLTAEEEIEAVRTHIEFQHYIHQTAQAKRANPTDDVISHLVQGDYVDPVSGAARKLTDAEIIGISDHLLTGGNETTTFALASGMWLLFQYPDVHAELLADRRKIRIFVEETLRIESPTQGLYRFTAREVTLRGVTIPKGSAVHVRYGAGNRDAARFPQPERPDLARRNAASHIAFGAGEHVCPGGALSRLEQVVAWDILLDRVPNMRPAPGRNDYTHLPGFWLRALKAMHVAFDPAPVAAMA